MTWSMDAIAASAAWAQAILTALAVWAAAKLQDRAMAKRDIELRNHDLEGVAAVGRYGLALFKRVLERLTDNMRGAEVAKALQGSELHPAQRSLKEIHVEKLGDVTLTFAVLDLEVALQKAEQALHDVRERGSNNRTTDFDARTLAGNHEVHVFNAAAGVERRVAELVKRKPML